MGNVQYVQRKIEPLTCEQCSSGKTICATHWDCVCKLRHTARNAHAQYCHLPSVRYIINATIFYLKKNAVHKMCAVIFATVIFGSNKNWPRYDHKCISVFRLIICYFGKILMKLEFSRQTFEKYANIKFSILTRTDRDTIKNVYWSSGELSVILVRF
jgi:hypothetical protein